VRMIDAAELEFLEILADSCAQAVERIEAQAAAAQGNERLAFLADASAELASSLDYGQTPRQGGGTGGPDVRGLVRHRRRR